MNKTIRLLAAATIGWTTPGFSAHCGTPPRVVEWTSARADSIGSDLDDLSADDSHAQVAAAQRLSTAVLDDASRGRVLQTLQPHLQSDDRTLRLASVQAYAHWATRQQVSELTDIVATHSSNEVQDGSAGVCAAAVVGLARLDSDAADRAVRDRMTDFFFRDATTTALLTMAEAEPAYAAVAGRLMQLTDPEGFRAQRMSVRDAETMLRSDSASTRTTAANALQTAPVNPQDRGVVLGLLKPHLDRSNGRARLPFVRAFVHWADEQNANDL